MDNKRRRTGRRAAAGGPPAPYRFPGGGNGCRPSEDQRPERANHGTGIEKACFDAYEAAGELTLTQEETAETIVPDYCPDAGSSRPRARCSSTAGRCETAGRRSPAPSGDGAVHAGGEGASGPGICHALHGGDRRTQSAGLRGAAGGHGAGASGDPDAEPRKVFTHCKLVTRLTGYQRRPYASARMQRRAGTVHRKSRAAARHRPDPLRRRTSPSPNRWTCPRAEGGGDPHQPVNSTVTRRRSWAASCCSRYLHRQPPVPDGGRPLRRVRAAVLSDPGGGRRPGGRRAIGAPSSPARHLQVDGADAEAGVPGDAVPPRHSSAAPDPGTDAPQ